MEVFIIIGWVILSFVIASMGESKKIGFGATLAICLLFSPIIGILVVIASDDKKQILIKKPNKEVIKLTTKATRLKNSGDIKEAMKTMKEALLIDPKFARTHYNIACLYSLQGDEVNAFKHLEKAAELKYASFKKVKTEPDFKYLRSLPEFENFVLNDYKVLEQKIIDSVPDKSNYISEIKELAELKEKGILTEEEFQRKKSHILEKSNNS